jgi:hypothetical protein
MGYVPDSDVESFETPSNAGDDDRCNSLEYRITGLTWHTPRYANTCNINSFLSAWVRKMRQSHGKYLKHVVNMDRSAQNLYRIADHALRVKNQINSEYVKSLWLDAALYNSGESSALRQPTLNCKGNNAYSIFQHLEHHSTFEIVSKCSCGTFYHRDYMLEVPDLKQIEILGDPTQLNKAEMPKCQQCNEFRILTELNPAKHNWLINFSYNGSTRRNNLCPLLSDIPQIVKMGEIVFKLEYITYVQDVPSLPNECHEVSLQFIRHNWYLYDDGRQPAFRRWGGKKYDQLNSRLQNVCYFKIL